MLFLDRYRANSASQRPSCPLRRAEARCAEVVRRPVVLEARYAEVVRRLVVLMPRCAGVVRRPVMLEARGGQRDRVLGVVPFEARCAGRDPRCA